MKSSYALVLAVGLGVAGAMLNSVYLHKKSQDVEQVNFVGLARDMQAGQRLTREDLVAVPISKGRGEKLNAFAFRYEDLRETVINKQVWRPLEKGWLLLEDDLRTPPQELTFGNEDPPPKEGKRALFVPLDPRAFVPSLLMGGDWVDFLVGRSSTAAGTTEIIGPFEVLSLGNRFGSAEVLETARVRQVQETTLTIAVRVGADGRLEGDAQRLADMLAAEDFRLVGVLLHERTRQQE